MTGPMKRSVLYHQTVSKLNINKQYKSQQWYHEAIVLFYFRQLQHKRNIDFVSIGYAHWLTNILMTNIYQLSELHTFTALDFLYYYLRIFSHQELYAKGVYGLLQALFLADWNVACGHQNIFSVLDLFSILSAL